MKYDLKIANDGTYKDWLSTLKEKIQTSQLQAVVQVNKEMLKLYWYFGKDIVERKAESIYGSGFYSTLSQSLKNEFPNMKGFSVTNLKYMKRFYMFYEASASNRQQPVDDLEILYSVPWGHHILIISKCKDIEEAYFYLNKVIANGWSRSILLNFLDNNLYLAQGKAITNFKELLPLPQGDLANEVLKDPYNFDFLTLTDGYKEKELEEALTTNIMKLLIELGQGFAFVGRQIPIQVGSKELFIDLLFYHLELRCYVVVELKICEFDPSFTGQLGVYVSAVNHQRKKETDNQSIGLLICKTKDNVMAEYSLESSRQPIGISEYNLSNILPKDYESTLPTIEEIESSIKNINKQ